MTQLYSVIDQGLEKLEIPSTVKTIGKNSFWNCDNLKRVVIPASVTRIGYNPFAGCDKLVLENHSPNYNMVDGVLFNKDRTELIYCPNQRVSGKYSIPNEVVKVGRNAFSFCVNLESVIVPEGVREIGRGAFGGCKNLKSIVLPESLQNIGEWAFSFCENLKNITLYRNTKIEENTFAHCNINIIRI